MEHLCLYIVIVVEVERPDLPSILVAHFLPQVGLLALIVSEGDPRLLLSLAEWWWLIFLVEEHGLIPFDLDLFVAFLEEALHGVSFMVP